MREDLREAPWWKSGLIAALIGVAIPAATFVQGWLQKERELALQERQQIQQIRLAYMNVLVEAGVQGMSTIADFIADTEQDPVVRTWAEKQREKAREATNEVEKRLLDEQQKAAEAIAKLRDEERRAARAEAEAERLKNQASADRALKEEATELARQARAEASVAEVRSRTAQEKVERSKEALSGRSVVQARERPTTLGGLFNHGP